MYACTNFALRSLNTFACFVIRVLLAQLVCVWGMSLVPAVSVRQQYAASAAVGVLLSQVWMQDGILRPAPARRGHGKHPVDLLGTPPPAETGLETYLKRPNPRSFFSSHLGQYAVNEKVSTKKCTARAVVAAGCLQPLDFASVSFGMSSSMVGQGLGDTGMYSVEGCIAV